MKTLSILFALVFSAQALNAQFSEANESALYTDYAELLDKYATATGVDYAKWAKSTDDLKAVDSILKTWSKLDLSELSFDQQKAFYINLYNLGMLKAVFDAYPVKSVTEILPDFGIFKKPFIQQSGRTLSLDDVEKVILLKEYPDPRIHWAVNCASRSCPPLRSEPFLSSKLDEQMDEQAQIFLNDQWGVQVKGREVHVSALFDWYKHDFPTENPIEYINPYRTGAKLPAKASVKFLPYDWSLNTPLSE
ncbi:MAG: DUF547 domain-containing protein [Opitutales bacterium]